MCTTSLHIPWVHGLYFTIRKKNIPKHHFKQQVNHFIYTLKGSPNFMILRFHNPRFHDPDHLHDLKYSIHTHPLKQAEDNHQGYTLKSNLS